MGYAMMLQCLLSLLALATTPTAQQVFKCTEGSTCRSLVGYKSPNKTTISSIQKFFGVKRLHSLLGANNLPLSTLPNYPVEEEQVIKIPIPCICVNGSGVSNKMPIYTVQPDDGLYYIANDVFMGLVTDSQIQAANRIRNKDLILVGQRLWIPLPCSCEDVDGEQVVHYGHVVKEGSSVEEVAEEYGTLNTTLYRLNGIANNSQFIAGTAFDVPLRACNSSVLSDSIDYPLLVANGTYVITANGCVKCKCDSANNWTLSCEPSGLKPSNWATCPPMQCQVAGNNLLYLSNTTTSSCNVATCAYAGFHQNQTIRTTLATESTCPASAPSGTTPTDPTGTTPTDPTGATAGNGSRMGLSWNFLCVSISLFLLPVHFL